MASPMLTTTAIPTQLVMAAHKNTRNWYVELCEKLVEFLASCNKLSIGGNLGQLIRQGVKIWELQNGLFEFPFESSAFSTFTFTHVRN